MKVTIFAHRGQVSAISFPGEAMNFNGAVVREVEADPEGIEAAILAVAPSGVGSPWPPVDAEVPKTPKAPKAPKA